ncbi:hypothetical protein [Arthrobacter methylotrophus]|uniref:hypothetical protein n=1 Tax=Arthrobacter methylotrophus TaxID=121291 RepID=UPI0031E67E90
MTGPLLNLPSLIFTTWTLTVFHGDLFSQIALFADGARLRKGALSMLSGLKRSRPRILGSGGGLRQN